MKILLVKDVVVQEVSDPVCRLARFDSMPVDYGADAQMSVREEIVEAEHYRKGNTDVMIALPAHVREVLGLPFECVKNLQHNLDYEKKRTRCVQKRVAEIMRSSFLTRLRFLFTSKI